MPAESSATPIAGSVATSTVESTGVPTAEGTVAVEPTVAPETNPAGDIPDSQAFVKYASAQGNFELEVPEGWARTESDAQVSFVDKLDGVRVTLTDTASAPSLESVQATWIPALLKAERAVAVVAVKNVSLPSGPAILVDYTSNSEPNEVTNKQVRLEDNAYLYYRGGKLAVLSMWAPVGADNVDQWQRMSESFKWR
jgi:hypothetical protein